MIYVWTAADVYGRASLISGDTRYRIIKIGDQFSLLNDTIVEHGPMSLEDLCEMLNSCHAIPEELLPMAQHTPNSWAWSYVTNKLNENPGGMIRGGKFLISAEDPVKAHINVAKVFGTRTEAPKEFTGLVATDADPWTAFHAAASIGESEALDNAAVDTFSMLLRNKMQASRAKGRNGWERTLTGDLADQFVGHLGKINSLNRIDLACQLMMLQARGAPEDVIVAALDRAGWLKPEEAQEKENEIEELAQSVNRANRKSSNLADELDAMTELRDQSADQVDNLIADLANARIELRRAAESEADLRQDVHDELTRICSAIEGNDSIKFILDLVAKAKEMLIPKEADKEDEDPVAMDKAEDLAEDAPAAHPSDCKCDDCFGAAEDPVLYGDEKVHK